MEQSDDTFSGGIYAISHPESGKQYIGSTKCFHVRWATHKEKLNSLSHHSPHLQRAWSKYGKDAFAFFILEIVEDITQLLIREQFWIDTQNPEYNATKIAIQNYPKGEDQILAIRQSAVKRKAKQRARAKKPGFCPTCSYARPRAAGRTKCTECLADAAEWVKKKRKERELTP